MKVCNQCGLSNEDANIFCSYCGQKLDNTVTSPQPGNLSSKYQITFQRPQAFQMIANLFHIKVDSCFSYELKNGGEITIPMSPGQHSIEISVFGLPKKTQFSFHAAGPMTFICKPNLAAGFSRFAAPVKVTDIYSREY